MKICLTGGIACGKSLLSHYLNELGIATCDADDIVHELIPADERKRLAATVFTDSAARRALEARIHPLVKARIEEWLGEGAGSRAQGFKGARANPQGPVPKSSASSLRLFASSTGASFPGSVPEDGSSTPRLLGSSPHQAPTPASFPGSVPEDGSSAPRLLGSSPHQAPSPQHQAPSTKIAVIPLLFEVHWEADYDIIACVASSRAKQIERMVATRGYTREEAEARLAAQMPVEEKAEKSHYVITNDGSAEDLHQEAARFVSWLRKKING